jgi:hypothetical protein
MTVVPHNHEKRLAARVADGEPNAADAALELLERTNPQTLDDAVALVWPDRKVPPERFDAVAQAWDFYRHVRDMPRD